jgi:hypothetical protein
LLFKGEKRRLGQLTGAHPEPDGPRQQTYDGGDPLHVEPNIGSNKVIPTLRAADRAHRRDSRISTEPESVRGKHKKDSEGEVGSISSTHVVHPVDLGVFDREIQKPIAHQMAGEDCSEGRGHRRARIRSQQVPPLQDQGIQQPYQECQVDRSLPDEVLLVHEHLPREDSAGQDEGEHGKVLAFRAPVHGQVRQLHKQTGLCYCRARGSRVPSTKRTHDRNKSSNIKEKGRGRGSDMIVN